MNPVLMNDQISYYIIYVYHTRNETTHTRLRANLAHIVSWRRCAIFKDVISALFSDETYKAFQIHTQPTLLLQMPVNIIFIKTSLFSNGHFHERVRCRVGRPGRHRSRRALRRKSESVEPLSHKTSAIISTLRSFLFI